MTAVDASTYPADKVVRIQSVFADGTVLTGAGVMVEPTPTQGAHNDEVMTAADLVWRPGHGAAVSVTVDPKINGANSYGEIAVDHYRYFPIASHGAAGDQFDFAVLH